MKLVYTATNLADAHLARDFLEQQGIRAIIRGEYLPYEGDLPLSSIESLPSVWVLDNADAVRAKQVLEEGLRNP